MGIFKEKKKYRFLSPVAKERRSILDEGIFLEENETKEKLDRKKRNYIRKPFAKQSAMVVILTVAVMAFNAICLNLSVRTVGNSGLTVSALVLCSMLVSLVGVVYGVLCLLEKGVRKSIGLIGLLLCAANLVMWVMVTVLGSRL